jgi:hypothetical protein
VHLIEAEFEFIIKHFFGDQIAHFDSHISLIIIEELARVVWLEHLRYGDVNQLGNDWSMFGQIPVKLT